MSISGQLTGSDSNAEDEPEEPRSYTAEKTAGAIGIAAGITANVLIIALLLAYIFGIETERLKKSGIDKNKLRYAAKEPLYAVVGIALGYAFNALLIGEQLTIPGVI